MISDIQRLIGAISVSSDDELITVKGVPSEVISKDISKMYSTSRISKYLFKDLKRSSFSFYRFFTMDVLFLLGRLKDEAPRVSTRRVVKHIIESIEEQSWVKTDDDDVDDILDWSKLKLFDKKPLDHQEEFFTQYNDIVPRYDLNGYMLAAPAGSGKTLIGLMLKEMLGVDALIVVPPKNALDRVWVTALNDEYKRAKTNYWTSLTGDEPDKDREFYLCHYEALEQLFEIKRHLKKKRVMVILDESHHMNEIKSQRTINFVDLCHEIEAEHVLWASGTPLKALGSEMIPFLRTVDPHFNDDVEDRFKRIFGMSVGRANDILRNRLGVVSYRVEKSNVVEGEPIEQDAYVSFKGAEKYTLENIGEEMAEFIKQRLDYYNQHRDWYLKAFNKGVEEAGNQIPHEDWREYSQYQDDVKRLMKASGMQLRQMSDVIQRTNAYEKNTLIPLMSDDTREDFEASRTVVKYVELKVRGEALGSILGRRRIEAHVEMLDHIDFQPIINGAKKKTLIFSSYVDVVETLEAELKSLKYSPVVVYGQTSSNIKPLLKQFANKDQYNPLVATYQSLSTAVPLISANLVVLLNQPFRDHERTQAISRVHRLGQDTQVYVLNVLLDTGEKKNISTRSLDIVEWSKAQVDSMMGSGDQQGSLESHHGRLINDDVHVWNALASMETIDQVLNHKERHRAWLSW